MIIDAHLLDREIKLVEIMQIFHRMLLNISPVTPQRMHRLVLTLILGRRQGLSVELANRAIC